MTCYSALLRRLPIVGEILSKFLQSGREGSKFFIIDSTSFKLCENIRFRYMKPFPDFAGWAHSSTRCVYGFKLHLAINESGKIIAFRLTKGQKHDICEAENLLKGFSGTAIGDKGYCSSKIRERLAKFDMMSFSIGVYRSLFQVEVECGFTSPPTLRTRKPGPPVDDGAAPQDPPSRSVTASMPGGSEAGGRPHKWARPEDRKFPCPFPAIS
jgi:hypothetical protein